MDPIDTFGRSNTGDGDQPLIEPTALLDSESPGSKQESGRKRFVCRRVVCCCLSRNAYLKCRGSTWDTLSRNASKFGRPTRFVPSRIFEAASVILILANVAYASVYLNAYEPGLNTSEGPNDPFHNFTDIVDGTPAVWVLDVVSVIFFTMEYGFRLWASVEARKYRPKKRGKRGLRCCGDRCRWFMKPLSLLDAAVLPVFFAALGCLLVEGHYRSWLAEIRVVVFFRLERQVKGLSRLKSVLGSKSEELVIALFFTLVCVLYGAVAMYFVEQVLSDPQINQFPTFTTALWWSSTVLSGNGYGDHIPQSWLGRVVAALVGLLGVLAVALPSGIIGATFIEIMATNNRDTAFSSFFIGSGSVAASLANINQQGGFNSTAANNAEDQDDIPAPVPAPRRRNFGTLTKSQRRDRRPTHRYSTTSDASTMSFAHPSARHSMTSASCEDLTTVAVRSRQGSAASAATVANPYGASSGSRRLSSRTFGPVRPQRTSGPRPRSRQASAASATNVNPAPRYSGHSPTSNTEADFNSGSTNNSPTNTGGNSNEAKPPRHSGLSEIYGDGAKFSPQMANVMLENEQLIARVAALERLLADKLLGSNGNTPKPRTEPQTPDPALKCPSCGESLQLSLAPPLAATSTCP